MNKENIKKRLIETFISEDKKPKSLSKTEKTQKDSKKENDDYQKEVKKKMEDYTKSSKQNEKENSDSVKKNELSEEETEVHDTLETLNGLEMVKYDGNVDKQFQDRAKEAIEGSSRMGNNPEWGNVVTADQAGFTGPEFGKKVVDRVNKRVDIENDVEQYTGMGDVAIPRGKNKKNKKTAVNETKKKLTFKKTFNGINGALNLIPESYKVDGKEFIMSDGNESYDFKWEGSLSEGFAKVLKTDIKDNLLNENLDHMKHLMEFKSEDVKINESLDIRNEINKTNKLLK